MKQINLFDLSRPRLEEVFGFKKLVVAETANLPQQAEGAETPAGSTPLLDQSIAQFKSAFDAFDAALKDSAAIPSSTIAAEADDARDKAWRSAYAYLKSMTVHPDEAVGRIAREAKTLADKYGDPTSLSQTEESGILHNLLQDWKAIENSQLTAIDFEPWLSQLDKCETAFLAAVAERTQEEAARQAGIVKTARKAAEAAYRSLITTVNALAMINGDAPYATFIDHVNVLIERQKTVLKTRTTNNRQKNSPSGVAE